MVTSTTSPTAVAQAIMDAVNAHDVDTLVTHYADVIDERMPDRTIRSRAELGEFMKELFAGVPDLRFEVHNMAEDGENVLISWTITGTHRGTFNGIKATGGRLQIPGFEMMTIRDGKLVANRVVFDRMGFGQQLGMLPADGSRQERGMKAAFNAATKLKSRFAERR